MALKMTDAVVEAEKAAKLLQDSGPTKAMYTVGILILAVAISNEVYDFFRGTEYAFDDLASSVITLAGAICISMGGFVQHSMRRENARNSFETWKIFQDKADKHVPGPAPE